MMELFLRNWVHSSASEAADSHKDGERLQVQKTPYCHYWQVPQNSVGAVIPANLWCQQRLLKGTKLCSTPFFL
jgi:hypothetical protein